LSFQKIVASLSLLSFIPNNLSNLLLLRPILTETLPHFTLIKKKCLSERERKMGLSVLINYSCILVYHKCRVEYIELRVIKVVLISVIIRKK